VRGGETGSHDENLPASAPLNASVDSYLAAMDYPSRSDAVKIAIHGSGARGFGWLNHYWKADVPFSHAKFGGYLVTRLDGYTQVDAEALVTRAVEAESAKSRTGEVLLDVQPGFKFKMEDVASQPLDVTGDIPDESDYGSWNADLVKAREDNKAKNFAEAEQIMQKDTQAKPDASVLWLELGRHQHGFQRYEFLLAVGVLKAEESGDKLLRIVEWNQALLQEDLITHLERDTLRIARRDRAIGIDHELAHIVTRTGSGKVLFPAIDERSHRHDVLLERNRARTIILHVEFNHEGIGLFVKGCTIGMNRDETGAGRNSIRCKANGLLRQSHGILHRHIYPADY